MYLSPCTAHALHCSLVRGAIGLVVVSQSQAFFDDIIVTTPATLLPALSRGKPVEVGNVLLNVQPTQAGVYVVDLSAGTRGRV